MCCLHSAFGSRLSDFIKNILICVLKMNEGLIGLERHEGLLITEYFLVIYPFKCTYFSQGSKHYFA